MSNRTRDPEAVPAVNSGLSGSRCFLLLFVVWLLSGPSCPGADSETPSAPAVPAVSGDDTNVQETLRHYLQLQEQLHATQLAIERNRKETEQAALETTKSLEARLQAIETALGTQRASEVKAMQSLNRVLLIVAGSFAVVGFAAMVLMVYFQWRTVDRLADISTGLPAMRALVPAPMPFTLEPSGPRVVQTGPAEEPNTRLLGALERLEKRVNELEHTAQPPLQEATTPAAAPQPEAVPPADEPAKAAETAEPEAGFSPEASQVSALLARGQMLLDTDKAEAALSCFDEILQADPQNAEALVKKGAALERLRKLDEAIACYDQAIAADSLMTIAYLHKGGLFNRMERFSEALECYEQALRTQEKRAA